MAIPSTIAAAIRAAAVSRSAAIVAGLCLLAGCTVPRPIERDHDVARRPRLSPAEILAPATGTPAEELGRLDALSDSPEVLLRRAHLLLLMDSPSQALLAIDSVLFGEPPPVRSLAAVGWLLRGEAHQALGDEPRARFDREKAAACSSDPDLRARLASAAPPPPTPNPEPAEASTTVIGRQSWHAAPALRREMVPMSTVERITIHHSAMLAQPETAAEVADLVRSIQKTHQQGNGWADIGYHFLIDRSGRIWEGRPLEWQGAHAGGPERNRGNIGICLLGNFVAGPSGQLPSADQMQGLESLLHQLCQRYGLGPDDIVTHRELRATLCPGDRLQAAVERIRAEMRANLAAAAPASHE